MTVEVAQIGERWAVVVMGVTLKTYARKTDAKRAAEEQAKRRGMELVIRRGDGVVQTSKYAKRNRWW